MKKFAGIAIIDMDGTLLAKRSIDVFFSNFNLLNELEKINKLSLKVPAYKITEEIVKLLVGKSKEELENIFSLIPLEPNAEQFINYLKKKTF